MNKFALTGAILFIAGAAFAEPPTKVEDDLGVLNPEDTGREMLIRRMEMGMIDSVTCSMAVNVTKNDDHVLGRKLMKMCADAGFTKSMTWLSQLNNNGLGGEYDPDASAEWDRRAAEAGDPVGKFNHGLNLMRGHGTSQDEELGRQFVDEAADQGLEIAQRLQGADYDLDEVTPDADNWKYGPMF
ncbi:hypothetical protein ATO10_00650 [Actibacterium atlanticum]|uniref:Sel1 repeat family protein n=1 Tax=Actibacterium atlanticum TaxID=1461693 RepID=A0A058ZPU8_9RHOB|nr:sel1 repeat family protein [Actibacterium atlanticum]KCV83225.1 hypothetical protein ATO10_00650 [Actibacterium atlanticum]